MKEGNAGTKKEIKGLEVAADSAALPWSQWW
jgi:hypothetical protein